MQKPFCDVCDQEITADKKVPAQISMGGNGTLICAPQFGKRSEPPHINVQWNSTDVCLYCLIDGVTRLDKRPRAA